MEELEKFGYLKLEDLGEGRQKITVFKLDDILNLVDFYTEWLFKSEDKRIAVEPKEVMALKSLVHYGSKETIDAKGMVRVNLTQMQASAQKDIGRPFSADDVNTLTEKGLMPEKISIENGIALNFDFKEIARITPHWDLIHTLQKLQRD